MSKILPVERLVDVRLIRSYPITVEDLGDGFMVGHIHLPCIRGAVYREPCGNPINPVSTDRIPFMAFVGTAHSSTTPVPYYCRYIHDKGMDINIKLNVVTGTTITEAMLSRAVMKFDICSVTGDYINPRIETNETSEDRDDLKQRWS